MWITWITAFVPQSPNSHNWIAAYMNKNTYMARMLRSSNRLLREKLQRIMKTLPGRLMEPEMRPPEPGFAAYGSRKTCRYWLSGCDGSPRGSNGACWSQGDAGTLLVWFCSFIRYSMNQS